MRWLLFLQIFLPPFALAANEGYFTPVAEKSCAILYGQMHEPKASATKSILAASVAAHLGVAGAVAVKYGALSTESEPDTEQKKTYSLKPRSALALLTEAKRYLGMQYRNPFKKPGYRDFPYGEWMLLSEHLDRKGSQKELDAAYQAYQELLGRTIAIRDENIPFLDKMQKVHELLVGGPLSGYCRGRSQLSSALLDHCGNCESSTKAFVSLLKDSNFPIEPPYQLGAQLFTDHIQAVLYNPQEHSVIALESNDLKKEVKSEIFHPDLLLHGFLTANGQSPVNREKDLLLVKADKQEKKKLDLGDESSGYSSDTSSDFGGASAAFSTGAIPEFARRDINKLGEHSNSFLGNGQTCDEPMRASKDEGTGKFSISWNQMQLSDTDSSIADKWPSESLQGRVDLLMDFIRRRQKQTMSAPEFHETMRDVTNIRALDLPARKEAIVKAAYYASDVSTVRSMLQTLFSCMPPSEEGNRKKTLAILFSEQPAEEIRTAAKRLAESIAMDPKPALREIHRLEGTNLNYFLGTTLRMLGPAYSRLASPDRDSNAFDGDLFTAPNGKKYLASYPLSALLSALGNPSFVTVEGAESKTKGKASSKENEITPPSWNLPPGDYGSIIVEPVREKEKVSGQKISIPPEKMHSLVVYYNAMNTGGDMLGTEADLLRLYTTEMMKISMKYNPDLLNLSWNVPHFAEAEALKLIPAWKKLLGAPRKAFAGNRTASNPRGVSYPDQISYEGANIKNPVELSFPDGPATEVKSGTISNNGREIPSVSFEFAGQPFNLSVRQNPNQPLVLNLERYSWSCEQKCEGPVPLKDFLMDPRMDPVRAELFKIFTPREKMKLEEMGIRP